MAVAGNKGSIVECVRRFDVYQLYGLTYDNREMKYNAESVNGGPGANTAPTRARVAFRSTEMADWLFSR